MQGKCDVVIITVHPTPPGEFGRMIGGVIGTPSPFGDGLMCIDSAPGILRLAPFRADSEGAEDIVLDFNSVAPVLMQPGTTILFQALYRDRNSNGLDYNLSSSLAIMLTP